MARFIDFRKWLTPWWSSYWGLLWYIILLLPIYALLIPWHFYTDGNNGRAIILASLCGGLVGVTEIASRYRDEQLKAILSPDGLVYILFNGAISSFALILIFHFRDTIPAFTTLKSTLLAAIAAGFGATAIMRTRLAVIKGSDNKEISIGPDIVINLLLSMIDRRIDRWRAAKRQQIVADHFSALKSLGSIDQTSQYLFASLLAFQNLSDTEKQQFTETIEANKKKISDVNIQFQALGFLFLTAVGEENFESAFDKAKKIQQEAFGSATPTGPIVPRATTGSAGTQPSA
jgi:hypothetical protein